MFFQRLKKYITQNALKYREKGSHTFVRTQDDVSGVTETEGAVKNLLFNLTKNLERETDYEMVYTEEELFKERRRIFFKEHYKEIILCGAIGICILHFLLYLIRMGRAAYYVNINYIPVSFFWGLVFSLLPIIIWVFATYFGGFSFENRRMALLYFCAINILGLVENFLQGMCVMAVVPLVEKIPISPFITKEMVLNLARLITVAFPVTVCLFIFAAFYKLVSKEETEEMLMHFCIRDYVDFRKHKEFCYDAHFVRRLDNGDTYRIKQQDRSLHMLVDGTTGTGKTSSVLSVSIADDMDQKVYNQTYTKKKLEEALKEGHVKLKDCMSDLEFNVNHFEAVDWQGKKLLSFLKKYVQDAGLTVMAPNAEFADEVYRLAKARGLNVNRIDPTIDPETGTFKEGYTGFNPLYITPGLPPLLHNIEVVKKARLCADVLQALYEMNGKGDPYFTSLNRNVTTCVNIMILLTYPRLHEEDPVKYPLKHPNLTVFQEILDSFDKAIPYAQKLRKMIENESEEERGFGKDTYNFVLCLVENDLLGQGKEKMFDQARGLRTLVDEFLTNPLLKQILCSENTVDLDKALEGGEITVVNYALELGRSDAVAFGDFFLLSLNAAVLRRKKNTRIPHFIMIDELPVLLHPSLEECFTLFRQYGAGMLVAIQTHDQMDRSDATRYLRGILMGNCATHILFGRISNTEMKLYEELSGTEKKYEDQETVSETPLTLPDTSKSFSVRRVPTDTPVLRGTRMRNLRFQEVTVFTVNEGSPVKPFFGKVSFLDTYKKLNRVTYHVDWSFYAPDRKDDVDTQEITGHTREAMERRVGMENILSVEQGRVYLQDRKQPEEEELTEEACSYSRSDIRKTGFVQTGKAFLSCGKDGETVRIMPAEQKPGRNMPKQEEPVGRTGEEDHTEAVKASSVNQKTEERKPEDQKKPVQWDEEERKEKKKVQEKDQPEENGEESYEALTLEELMAIVKEKEGHA